ncbi:hypothetical protein N656DRAFT_800436 [Canariomyces notabilis]|uniref:Uncharacterized protein n=1 Tax=Canariomyces notabilis TaxID=2074819 RepID=A0AAN6QHP9_9PEZI|nr:hypothetical protein N656DRAFT_800436 [Canariomyces arenarius]
MANDLPKDLPRISSPDRATSEANSSTRVHLDARSNRDRSIVARYRSPSRRPSPSRIPEQSLARQATANSLSPFYSSQSSSSQPSQNDRAPAEDVLRDLVIAVTEPGGNSSSDVLFHGIKRPHDDEVADEPLAKRDRLGEELDELAASHREASSTTVSPASPATLTWSVTVGVRTTLPVRPNTRRRRQKLVNGTESSYGDPLGNVGSMSPSDDDPEEVDGNR